MTPVFRGKIVNGRLICSPQESEKLAAYLQSFPDGALVNYFVKKVDFSRPEPVQSDPLRKYYFKFVVKPIREHTGASVEDIHETMKSKYSYTVDEFGITHLISVFSNGSTMSIRDKKEFVANVRDWALDFLEVRTQEFEPKALID